MQLKQNSQELPDKNKSRTIKNSTTPEWRTTHQFININPFKKLDSDATATYQWQITHWTNAATSSELRINIRTHMQWTSKHYSVQHRLDYKCQTTCKTIGKVHWNCHLKMAKHSAKVLICCTNLKHRYSIKSAEQSTEIVRCTELSPTYHITQHCTDKSSREYSNL
jgi:hypothetical protein